MLIKSEVHKQRFIQQYEKLTDTLRLSILQSDNIEKAIKYAAAYGEIRAYNHDGVYADEAVELHIQALAMAQGLIDTQVVANARADGVMVIATDVYDYGGHTKVLLTWLRLMKQSLPHKLLITRSLTERTEKSISEIGVNLTLLSEVGLTGILAILQAAQGFNRIVMMINPQDIVAAIAARILAASGYEIIFYNHADHLFTYGIGAAHSVCEISAYGEVINERSQRVKGISCRLGVPLKQTVVAPVEPHTEPTTQKCKVIFSAGTSYKYKPDHPFIFADALDSLLARRSDIRVVLVGPTGQEPWWQGRRARWGERVKFCGTLQQAEYLQLLQSADVYVDSYPVTGGTAFPEALLAGKACTGLITPVQGYTLADQLKVESSELLVVQIEKLLDRDELTLQQIEQVRQQVAVEQNEATFQSRITSVYAGQAADLKIKDQLEHRGLDTTWLEDKWRDAGAVLLPRRKTIAALPINGSLRLLCAALCLKAKFGRC